MRETLPKNQSTEDSTDDSEISLSEPFDENSSKIVSSDFLSAIIHELRTPLNAIISFSDLLTSEIKSTNLENRTIEECANYASEINQTAQDLNEIINDLLDVGQISSGRFSVNLNNEIDIRDIIKRSVRLNYDYALQRKITLKVEIADELKTARLDPKRMKQILTNLVSNAIKYSPEHSEIKISAKNSFCYPEALEEVKKIALSKNAGSSKNFPNQTPTPGSLEITILDHGFGMNESQLKNLFVKYKTFSNPNSGKVDSFGLGLPITKQLVEMQDGEILVKSQIGVGTEIKLKFKL